MSKDDWETPEKFFQPINEVMKFTVDVAATWRNSKCEYYYDEEENGLKHTWKDEVVWCNPPYLRQSHAKWVRKAVNERVPVCLLIPAATSTKMWHNKRHGIWKWADAVLFPKRRISFLLGGKKVGAPRFESAAVFMFLSALPEEQRKEVEGFLAKNELGNAVTNYEAWT